MLFPDLVKFDFPEGGAFDVIGGEPRTSSASPGLS